MIKHPTRLLPIVLLATALALAACDGQGTAPTPTAPGSGPPRTFAMGLSSLPPELTEESYAGAFELAASAGEVILIQRVPPWSDLLAGDVSDDTAQTAERETELAKEYGLHLFFAIDLADASEEGTQFAGLPAELGGAGFADEKVRQAFITYARYVVVKYQPQYLALGVEVNTYQKQDPEGFEQFVTLYGEAYDAVKELSPETLVFPTFQLEGLQGRLPSGEVDKPQWHLIDRFEPKMDLLAVSTYPSLALSDDAQIPADYYTQLASYTDLPIAIAEMGYSSEPTSSSTNGGSEEQQAAFLRETLEDAERLAMPLVVWFVGQDPMFTGEPPFDMLPHIGLKRQNGTMKPAWLVWREAARRPLADASWAGLPDD